MCIRDRSTKKQDIDIATFPMFGTRIAKAQSIPFQEHQRNGMVNPAVPEALEEITNRAMAKDPATRYPTAGDMLADLEEFKKNPSIRVPGPVLLPFLTLPVDFHIPVIPITDFPYFPLISCI